jgi:hypothetical protein
MPHAPAPPVRASSLLLALLLPLAAACSGAADEDPSATEDEASRSKVGVNDVSILFPLPAPAQESLLLGPSSSGARGELLPKALYDKLPRLAAAPSGDVDRGMLRVVGVRIDPCFPVAGATDAGGCSNQLRLVMQPVHPDAEGTELTTEDAAVHLFYEVTRDEMATMARELLDAKRAAGGYRAAPLGIHPLMKKQGIGGVYGSAIKKLVLDHAGEKNLTRFTFMTRENSRQPLWHFGAFDMKSGRAVASPIPTLGTTTLQSVSTPGFGGMQATITPAPRAEKALPLLFSSFEMQAAKDDAVKASIGAALRVDNPGMHSPNTVDCASCHLSTPARTLAEKARKIDSTTMPDRFSATKLSLVNSAADNVRADNLRAFGYLGTEIAFSQRVVNESAATADYVNQKVLGR